MAIVLSARDAPRLKRRIEQLATHLQGNDVPLQDLAYTLQIGREAMRVRAATVVGSLDELRQRLQAYLDAPEAEGWIKAQAPREPVQALPAAELDAALQAGDHDALLQAWVRGQDIDWLRLYPQRPRRVHLPVYPFDEDASYWLKYAEYDPAAAGATPTLDAPRAAARSPVAPGASRIEVRCLDAGEAQVIFGFRGDERFFADHRVQGTPTLPGAATLQLVREACRQAFGELLDLADLVWLRPYQPGRDGLDFTVILSGRDDGFEFRVCSGHDSAGLVDHARGRLCPPGTVTPAVCDLAAARSACDRGVLAGDRAYALLEGRGLQYGPSLRLVQAIHRGDDQLLAALEPSPAPPSHVAEPATALVDAALQATIGLQSDAGDDGDIVSYLPFSLERWEVPGDPAAARWSLARVTARDAGLLTLDVTLCDSDGRVCSRLVGLVTRPMQAAPADDEPAADTLCLQPVWVPLPLPLAAAPARDDGVRHVVVCCEMPPAFVDEVAAQVGRVNCLVLPRHEAPLDRRFVEHLAALHAFVREQVLADGAPRCFLQLVVPDDGDDACLSALSAWLGTACEEDPRLAVQILAVPSAQARWRDLADAAACRQAQRLRWLGGRLHERSWQDIASASPAVAPGLPWKEGGVYLITGGHGGIGRLLAVEIARRLRSCTLVLAGRSTPGDVAPFEAPVADRVIYRQADVSDAAQVERLLQDVVAAHGRIDGIVHAAGIVRDRLIQAKPEAELRAVLAPKVHGLVHLDHASRAMALDFFVAFSSVAGIAGNVGQADYAAANAFMDEYLRRREERRLRGERSGRSLAIAWPVWQAGMTMPEAVKARLRRDLGLVPMPVAAGLRAWDDALASQASQVLVLHGERERMLAALHRSRNASHDVPLPPVGGAAAAAAGAAPVAVPLVATDDGLLDPARALLAREMAAVIRLDAHRIDPDEPMSAYGIDSVMAVELTTRLERSFGRLPKTLFFQYRDLASLARYVIVHHSDALRRALGGGAAAAAAAGAPAAATTLAVAPPPAETAVLLAASRPAIAASTDVAIIGLSARYPGAEDAQALWQVLQSGTDCITEVPADRWRHEAYFDPARDVPGKTYAKWGGFLRDHDCFDPLFFQISPRDAELMDPQERLFLQGVHEAIEDAGYTRAGLGRGLDGSAGPVGVYAGVMYQEYPLHGGRDGLPALSGNISSVANRVSHFFDFRGPSLAVDTMCSSSLTAIHLACEALRTGDVAVAIAGGVNLSLHPNKYLTLAQANFASSKGRCESFGAGGDGYVPAEGVGVLVLKPAAAARRDRDHVHALIKGSAVNHGGRTNGYTVPNPDAQADVIRRAFARAGVDPATVGYVEAHGTGTSLGDPIEIASLASVFGAARPDGVRCAIGSIKSNIGHAEAAAGVAGITKVLLQMRHRRLVPSLHSATTNPHIDFAATPFHVQQSLADWPAFAGADGRPLPRRAGVSAFGAGGSNAHVVLEECSPETDPATAAQHPAGQLIVLSARTPPQLRQRAESLLRAVDDRAIDRGLADADLPAVACTLQTGRDAMEHRLAIVAATVAALRSALQGWLAGSPDAARCFAGHADPRERHALLRLMKAEVAALAITWMGSGQQRKLAEAWAAGLPVNWDALWTRGRPRRLPLATYPFARTRYWVSPAAGAVPVAEAAASRLPTSRPFSLLVRRWVPSPLPAGRLPVALPARVRILFDADTAALAALLAPRFPEARTIDVREASAIEDWSEAGDLVHLAGPEATLEDPALWLDRLGRLAGARSPGRRLLYLRLVTGLDTSDAAWERPDAAACLYQSVAAEYRDMAARTIAIDAAMPAADACELMLRELGALSRDGDLAVRQAGGIRQAAVIDARPADAAPAAIPRLTADQVLFITGGTRGIGWRCARHFVERHGVTRLVLTGRKPWPERARWEALLRDEPASDFAARLRELLAWEARGVRVRIAATRLSDEAAAAALVHEVEATLGPIGGVLHCAGAVDLVNPALVAKDRDSMAPVLEPKVTGLSVLHRAVSAQPLRFFVLFSSVSALLPSLAAGQVDYAVANAWMDEFAARHAGLTPMMSVRWPNWKDVGLGEAKSPVYARSGLASHTGDEGLAMLDAVLAAGAGAVVTPAVLDAAHWVPGLPLRVEAAAPSPIAVARAAARTVASAGTAGDALRADLCEHLRRLFAEALKLPPDQLDPELPHADYGADSVLLTQVLSRLSRAIGRALDPTLLYEHANVAALAEHLLAAFPDDAARLLAAARPLPPMPPVPTPATSLRLPASPVDEPPPTPAPRDALQQPARRTSGPADIAIVGLSCRFPGAEDLVGYWRLLREGTVAIRRVPPGQWGSDAAHQAGHFAGLLDARGEFAHRRFHLAAEDAAAMDAQALLLLEQSAALVAHAGCAPADLKGSNTGVYVGGRSAFRGDAAALGRTRHAIVALGQNYLAANIARFLDVQGPSLVVDSACSSALVAMQLAVQALRAGEIDAAIVAGVSAFDSAVQHEVFAGRGLLDETGAFHVFDRRARGVVPAEGVGLVMLKTVEQALRDGDAIHGVIRAIAVNNDGRTPGATTPNVQAQRDVMARALRQAGVRPEDVGHIEVNGSGSPISDLMEMKAIDAVYGGSARACRLGSIKPNIGHPLCAEGIAGFIKVVLMLKHRAFVPFLSGAQPMEHFDFAASRFRFGAVAARWEAERRIAALNCFADGGTNAHVLVEEWIGRDPSPSAGLSAPAALAAPKPRRRLVWEAADDEGGS